MGDMLFIDQTLFDVYLVPLLLVGLFLVGLSMIFMYQAAKDQKGDLGKGKVDDFKKDFISVASHQLRAPLASLKWYGELLENEESGKLNKKQKEFVRRMNVSTERMHHLIDDFLNASRIEEGQMKNEPRRFYTLQMLKGIVDSNRHTIKEKQLRVSVKNEARTKMMFQDPELVRELFANVISNAVKYTKDKGRVKITIADEGPMVLVRVTDTGMGIPEDEHDQVFSKFFRARNIVEAGYKGTGLGLYAAKEIAKHLGGDIVFVSVPDQGSTFTIKLPRTGKKQRK